MKMKINLQADIKNKLKDKYLINDNIILERYILMKLKFDKNSKKIKICTWKNNC